MIKSRMNKEEQRETVERLTKKLVTLSDSEKSFVMGYLTGKEEEREHSLRHEKKVV